MIMARASNLFSPLIRRFFTVNANTSEGNAPVALIFDTETTGLVKREKHFSDTTQPYLLQLGLILVDTGDWSIKSRSNFLVKLDHGVKIDKKAEATHGITFACCNKFGLEPELAGRIFYQACCNAHVLVSHNMSFDRTVMAASLFRSGFLTKQDFQADLQLVCTMNEAKKVLKLPGKFASDYKLPSLTEAYAYFSGGKEIVGAHDALVDSEACLAVFRGLVESGDVVLRNDKFQKFIEKSYTSSTLPINSTMIDSLEVQDPQTSPTVATRQGKIWSSTINSSIVVSGSTYDHKDKLKSMGGKWSPEMKAWTFDPNLKSEVETYIRQVSSE
uniref:Exonuclease domain-containing protein n=1 Tax=Proboscia inermis TaxID=420281 RepID=A0A7S0C6G0_9STRA|mmetsp:Transcript_41951/g.50320  ORF Transcript_41951/g.50320 Transcript_41951/m.50320 type:complete len:330 (+) Transcript_41951:89-1078(+)